MFGRRRIFVDTSPLLLKRGGRVSLFLLITILGAPSRHPHGGEVLRRKRRGAARVTKIQLPFIDFRIIGPVCRIIILPAYTAT